MSTKNYSESNSTDEEGNTYNEVDLQGLVATKSDTDTHTVSPSSTKNKKRTSTDAELSSDDDDEGEDGGLLHKFPFKGVDTVLYNDYIPGGRDPRGYHETDEHTLPYGYCKSCRCHKKMCHDKRFGMYCGLRVAEQVAHIGQRKLTGDKVKNLMKRAYNEILRVETVQHIGVLDTHNNYDIPACLLTKSYDNILSHFYYEKFSYAMKVRLEDGSKGKRGSQKYGFYAALHEQSLLDEGGNE